MGTPSTYPKDEDEEAQPPMTYLFSDPSGLMWMASMYDSNELAVVGQEEKSNGIHNAFGTLTLLPSPTQEHQDKAAITHVQLCMQDSDLKAIGVMRPSGIQWAENAVPEWKRIIISPLQLDLMRPRHRLFTPVLIYLTYEAGSWLCASTSKLLGRMRFALSFVFGF